MYSSGTTGKPKGTVHTHCGMLAKNALDVGLCIDLKATDRLLWMSDMGWIVGPKIVVSATLLGATLVLAEGTPDWPQESRMWHVAADNKVTVIGIVPTMVRQMMRRGPELLAGCDLLALRTTISIGEPWTQDAWIWFFEHVCKRRIPILNYAGGTECGGAILISSFLSTLRPCSFGHAVPGCGADVVDAAGRSLASGRDWRACDASPFDWDDTRSLACFRSLYRKLLENHTGNVGAGRSRVARHSWGLVYARPLRRYDQDRGKAHWAF